MPQDSHKKAHQRGVIYMTRADWAALKIEAARQGLPMGELVARLIQIVVAAPEGASIAPMTVQLTHHNKDPK